VQGQLGRDADLVGLVKVLEDVYSFVEVSDSFQKKVQLLEDTIGNILSQTVECAIFIREYTGHGFGGNCYGCALGPQSTDDVLGRLLRQTFGDYGRKITELSQAFISLKQSLDSSNIIQSVFVSTRTLDVVEKLGLCIHSTLRCFY
jgi:hypothetical protein